MRVINYILLLITIPAYLLATVGFSLHICERERSVDLLLISLEKECEELHHGYSCNLSDGGCCNESDGHDEECCSTQNYLLDLEVEKGKSIKLSPIQKLIILQGAPNHSLERRLYFLSEMVALEAPPLLPKLISNSLPKLSQWRL